MSRGTAFYTRLHVRSEDTDHPRGLISLRCSTEGAFGPRQPTLCPAKTDQTADLSVRCAHLKSCRKCYATAHIHCNLFFDVIKLQVSSVP